MFAVRTAFPLILLPALLLPALGCPSDDDDDDATSPGDDDDATTPGDDDDDDDSAQPCEAEDITDTVLGGSTVFGDTTGASDDFTPSCVSAGIPVAEDLLWFVAPEAGTWLLSTANPGTAFDTLIFAFSDCANPADSELACNDDIDYDAGVYTSAFELELDAGEGVYIGIEGYDSEGAWELSVLPLVCGDGVVAGDEVCDDENTEPGDGCDANCQWECAEDPGEDDDSTATATPLADNPASVSGVLCPNDWSAELEGYYLDLFAVEVAEGEFIEASVEAGGVLSADCASQSLGLAIIQNSPEAGLVVAANDDSTDGECAQVAAEPEAGTWFVVLYWFDPLVAPQDYVLTVAHGVSVCGDGTQEGLEECDDSNLDGGDGCTADCLQEDAVCPMESDVPEPGGDAVAGDTSGGADNHAPSCSVAGSPDLAYEVTFDAAGPVVATLVGPGTSFDSVLYVRSGCVDPGSELACNDDSQDTYQSTLAWEAEAGTPYWLIVDGYAGDAGPFELRLYVPVCGDETVDPNEDCDDGNEDAGDGCEPDCTVTPTCAYPSDLDLGELASGGPTSASVDLTAMADDLPYLGCGALDGNDAQIAFSLATGGALTIDVDHSGADVQYQLVADDGDCTELVACTDFYPAETGQLAATVGAGSYRLVMEAYAAGWEGTVNVTINAP